MKDAAQAVPEGISARLKTFWAKVVSGRRKLNGKHSICIGEISEKVKNAVFDIYGKNVTRQTITIDDMKHIYYRHGKNIAKELADGQIPVTEEIVALIPDVLTDPDHINCGGKTKGQGYDTIVVSKEYADGCVHTVHAVINDSTLKIHTLYVWNEEKAKNKRLDCGEVTDSRQLRATMPDPQNEAPSNPNVYINNITNSIEKINT
jgi:hypothetical protein